MTAALTLNGVTVPIASWERVENVALGGEVGPGASGRQESGTRKRKALWRGRTTPLSAAEARGWRGLLEGRGQSWTFNTNVYSARGLGLSSGSGIIFTAGGGPGPKYIGALAIATKVKYPVGANANWTVMSWALRPVISPLTWHHYIWRSSGGHFKDGVANAEPAIASLSGSDLLLTPDLLAGDYFAWAPSTMYNPGDRVVGGGRLWEQEDGTNGTNPVEPTWPGAPFGPGSEIEEDGGGGFGGPWLWFNIDTGLDDLVFLPYLVPNSWVPGLYAEASARAWTAQPHLRASGDLISARTVQGRLTGTQPVAHGRSGALDRAGESLSFELLEAA